MTFQIYLLFIVNTNGEMLKVIIFTTSILYWLLTGKGHSINKVKWSRHVGCIRKYEIQALGWKLLRKTTWVIGKQDFRSLWFGEVAEFCVNLFICCLFCNCQQTTFYLWVYRVHKYFGSMHLLSFWCCTMKGGFLFGCTVNNFLIIPFLLHMLIAY
jgi:hypothetical protein